MKERSKISKWFRKWSKKLSVGLKASANLEKANPKLRVVAASTLMAIAATTANAQNYTTYNYGGTYYGNRDTTFANQNGGGYTYQQPDRSQNFLIQWVMWGISGLRGLGPTRDPSAPPDRAGARSQMSQLYQ